MGHAVSIASGIALARPRAKVVCLDGDGAMLMHMGALSNSAQRSNLVHIVLNNGAHDSVGGQPTQALHLNLADIASCCGYGRVIQADSTEDVANALGEMLDYSGSSFLEIRCRRGARADLARPDRSPSENRRDFMAFLEGADS
jgi:phosphonopyruvate decarboxylase